MSSSLAATIGECLTNAAGVVDQHINLAEGCTHLRQRPVDFDNLAHVCVKRSGTAAGASAHLDYLSASSALLQSRTTTHVAALPDTRAVAAARGAISSTAGETHWPTGRARRRTSACSFSTTRSGFRQGFPGRVTSWYSTTAAAGRTGITHPWTKFLCR